MQDYKVLSSSKKQQIVIIVPFFQFEFLISGFAGTLVGHPFDTVKVGHHLSINFGYLNKLNNC